MTCIKITIDINMDGKTLNVKSFYVELAKKQNFFC